MIALDFAFNLGTVVAQYHLYRRTEATWTDDERLLQQVDPTKANRRGESAKWVDFYPITPGLNALDYKGLVIRLNLLAKGSTPSPTEIIRRLQYKI